METDEIIRQEIEKLADVSKVNGDILSRLVCMKVLQRVKEHVTEEEQKFLINEAIYLVFSYYL